jgi:chromosome segregation ATPase
MCEETIHKFITELQKLMEESSALRKNIEEFTTKIYFGPGLYDKDSTEQEEKEITKHMCLHLDRQIHKFIDDYYSIIDRWSKLEAKIDVLKKCDEKKKKLEELNKQAERFAKDIDAISRDLVLLQTHYAKCLLNVSIHDTMLEEMKAKGLKKGGKTRRKYRHSKKTKSNRKTR